VQLLPTPPLLQLLHLPLLGHLLPPVKACLFRRGGIKRLYGGFLRRRLPLLVVHQLSVNFKLHRWWWWR
jgi:hypothetical protein